ncbi:MAG: sugar ABC transporter permease [Phycisphaerales bacterium]|nr:sugar ABC transporter permease [Phycisphaerales bacterium]
MIDRRSTTAYSFLAFPLAILVIFTLAPTVLGLGLSLFQWDGHGAPSFVGLSNFSTLVRDPRFWPALRNTVVFGVVSVPPAVVLAFLFAVAVHARWFRGKAIIRTLFFMPTIISVVAIGFVWRWLLDDQAGLLNWALGLIGVTHPPNWLQDGYWPFFWIIVIAIWQKIGFCLVLYLAALAGINETLYEAAEVDGASRFEVLRHITWPQAAPMTAFLTVTGMISAFMIFDLVYVVTGSGAAMQENNHTNVLNLYIYRQFTYGQLGLASAIGVVIFVLTGAATGTQLALFRRRDTAGSGA